MSARELTRPVGPPPAEAALPARRGMVAAYVLLVVAALAFLYRSAALFVWNAWMADPYYTHGLVVFLAAVGLAAWRLAREPAQSAPPAWAPATLALAGLLFLAGFVLHDAYLVVWSALVLAVAAALVTGGLARLRSLGMPLLLVALTLPTPWTIELGAWLQGLAFTAATAVLAAFGVPLESGLTTFAVGDLAFEVTPACSGFQSAVSLVALGAVIATVFRLPRRRRAAVLLAAAPVALALNVARILAVVGVGVAWGAAAAEGFFHTWSSGILFAAESLVLLGIAGLFGRRREVARGEA